MIRLHVPSDVEPSRSADEGVGVVIPVFNRRTTLLDTLPFVVDQTTPPAKLVIVDDGSTDGTPAAAEAWLARCRPKFPWRVVRAPHSSAAAARNIGLAEVQSLPLIAFLDSDDHWPAYFLARATVALAEQPQANVAVADRSFIDAFGDPVDHDDCRQLVKNPVVWLFQRGAGVASCAVARTDAVVAAGGWSVDYGSAEDSVLFCDLAQRAPWVHLPGAPVQFHLGSARARSEEHNLSQRNPASHLNWARIYEDIFKRFCQANPTAARGELHKALAMRWYWAGKQLFKLGRADEARDCFRRAISWQPTMFRAWRRLASTGAAQWGKPVSHADEAEQRRRSAG